MNASEPSNETPHGLDASRADQPATFLDLEIRVDELVDHHVMLHNDQITKAGLKKVLLDAYNLGKSDERREWA